MVILCFLQFLKIVQSSKLLFPIMFPLMTSERLKKDLFSVAFQSWSLMLSACTLWAIRLRLAIALSALLRVSIPTPYTIIMLRLAGLYPMNAQRKNVKQNLSAHLLVALCALSGNWLRAIRGNFSLQSHSLLPCGKTAILFCNKVEIWGTVPFLKRSKQWHTPLWSPAQTALLAAT